MNYRDFFSDFGSRCFEVVGNPTENGADGKSDRSVTAMLVVLAASLTIPYERLKCHGARQNRPPLGASKPASVVMLRIPHRRPVSKSYQTDRFAFCRLGEDRWGLNCPPHQKTTDFGSSVSSGGETPSPPDFGELSRVAVGRPSESFLPAPLGSAVA